MENLLGPMRIRIVPAFLVAVLLVLAPTSSDAAGKSAPGANATGDTAAAPANVGPLAAEPWPPKRGAIFKDCGNCPEMVVIPSGLFIMGVGAKRKLDKPAHRVNIAKPFAIGRFEVTFREWQACLEAKGCTHHPDDHRWGRIRRPVVNITWDQAKGYVKWLSAHTGHVYRLPSEAEWEYAHRGGTTTNFWWGDEPGENRANCKDCKSPWSAKSSAPVGSFKPNPFGLYDTSANVFEWVEDCWNRDHRGAPVDGSARTVGDCKNRIIRGGSFYYFNNVSRSHYRAKNPASVKSYWLGFRVLREL